VKNYFSYQIQLENINEKYIKQIQRTQKAGPLINPLWCFNKKPRRMKWNCSKDYLLIELFQELTLLRWQHTTLFIGLGILKEDRKMVG